jgi:hypothetical protein
MSEQTLIGISGFPAPVMAMLPFGNSAEFTRGKMMLSTECIYAMNEVFSPIGRSDDEGLHPITFALLHLLAGLSSVLVSKRILIANIASMQFCGNFRRELLSKAIGIAKHHLPLLLAGLSSMLRSQTRASKTINVVTSLAERLQLIKPVLFTSGQEFRSKYQFPDFEGERIGAVLIESILHLWVAMFIVAEFITMNCPSVTQIDGTTNIEQACNGASDAVNAGGSRDSGHSLNCLSFSGLVFAGCQGNKAIPSSPGAITPELCSHRFIIPFFGRQQKTEVEVCHV